MLCAVCMCVCMATCYRCNAHASIPRTRPLSSTGTRAIPPTLMGRFPAQGWSMRTVTSTGSRCPHSTHTELASSWNSLQGATSTAGSRTHTHTHARAHAHEGALVIPPALVHTHTHTHAHTHTREHCTWMTHTACKRHWPGVSGTRHTAHGTHPAREHSHATRSHTAMQETLA